MLHRHLGVTMNLKYMPNHENSHAIPVWSSFLNSEDMKIASSSAQTPDTLTANAQPMILKVC